MSYRYIQTIYEDGQQIKPGYIWADPASLNLPALDDNIASDLTTGNIGDERWRRFFDSGSVSAQQALNGMIAITNSSIAALPVSQQKIPTAGGTSQTQTGTTRTIVYQDILHNLNKYYGNFWDTKFAAAGTGVSPLVVRKTPIVQATFAEHSCAIATLSIVSGVARITTTANHGLYNKNRVTITGTGDVDYDNQSFYIKKISATAFELYTDSGLTTAATAAVSVTTGTATIHASETHRFKITSLRVFSWGENVYSYMSGNSTLKSNAARFDGKLYTPQNVGTAQIDSFDDPDQGYFSRWAFITCTTNSLGHLTSVVLNTEFPGQYADPGWAEGFAKQALLGFANKEITSHRIAGPNTGAQWETPGYVAGFDKSWPTDITAQSVTLTLDSPTAVVATQSGRVFTRSSGMPSYTLRIKYPPMNREQFKPILNAIQRARGQHIQFHLDLNDIAPGSFTFNGNAVIKNLSPVGTVASGSTTFKSGGGDVLKYQAVKASDPVQLPEMGNGEIGVVTHDAHTSAWGTLDIRTTTPLYRPVTLPTTLGLGATQMVATLNNDKAEINIDTIERYGVELEFVARNWS